MADRALFLFDGPNFYKNMLSAGLDKGHLDYMKLARNPAGPRDVAGVHFFTSPLDQQSEPQNYASQHRFFARLQSSGVTLRLGHLVARGKACAACGAINRIKVEKSVDVQIAVELMHGCAEDIFDVVYIATCDSDIIPAIDYVRAKGKRVFLVFPEGAPCYAVANACDVRIPVKQATLDAAQDSAP